MRSNVKLTRITDADLRAMQLDRDELNRLQPYDQEDARIPQEAVPVTWLWPLIEVAVGLVLLVIISVATWRLWWGWGSIVWP